VRFPAEDGGHSLAEMAQRDLDAALQLLADRAQYITGANGAAIALRRGGKKDLLCRASIGPNAPELGALLSTEFGLSGESVRTRRALRCDDAERDARVNREVCRQLGIASVVVMPVVHDDEVLGVFELFSGKAHAFGERDLSALARLSEMVETAVRLARAAEQVPEPPMQGKVPGHIPPVAKAAVAAAAASGLPVVPKPPAASQIVTAKPEPPIVAKPATKKLLLWSAPAGVEVQPSIESDVSTVPPVLRSLRKCEACGFPISTGRSLCVECEEKKWRGQLKRPQTLPFQPAAQAQPSMAGGGPPTRTFAAAVPTMRSATPSTDVIESKHVTTTTVMTAPASIPEVRSTDATQEALSSSLDFNLSAGLESSQSWFSANKYILGAIATIAATVAAILLLR
jgi:hypothetical protein